MEQSVNEIQELLGQLQKNFAGLIPSFEKTAEEQAEKLASKPRKELRKLFKFEQDDANKECKRIKLETEELIKDIGRSTRKTAQDIRRKHRAKLKDISQSKEIKKNEKLDKTAKEIRNHTLEEEGYCSGTQFMEISNSHALGSSVPAKCATCGKESARLYFCAGCKVTRYCDEICQTKDWVKHKDACVGLSQN